MTHYPSKVDLIKFDEDVFIDVFHEEPDLLSAGKLPLPRYLLVYRGREDCNGHVLCESMDDLKETAGNMRAEQGDQLHWMCGYDLMCLKKYKISTKVVATVTVVQP